MKTIDKINRRAFKRDAQRVQSLERNGFTPCNAIAASFVRTTEYLKRCTSFDRTPHGEALCETDVTERRRAPKPTKDRLIGKFLGKNLKQLIKIRRRTLAQVDELARRINYWEKQNPFLSAAESPLGLLLRFEKQRLVAVSSVIHWKTLTGLEKQNLYNLVQQDTPEA